MIHPSSPRPWALATRGATLAIAALFIAGCANVAGPGAPAAPVQAAASAAQAPGYLERAQRQSRTRDEVTVSTAVLRRDEGQAHFGMPLIDKGVQPVWVQITNHGTRPFWLMRSFMDPDFYSPREVARLFRSAGTPEALAAFEHQLINGAIKLQIGPGKTVSGFVYTTASRGLKLINVELLGLGKVLRFDFAEEQSSGDFDYQLAGAQRARPSEPPRNVPLSERGAELQKLPCCTTDAAGTGQGDPLNLAIVGSERDVLVALARSGWDFTETISAASVGRMISAFAFGSANRNSPISALFFDGRSQDFAMQHARTDISQRSHLRFWQTALQVDGQPVWIGQISRDIGVKVTTLSKTLTTHMIDPQVDHARFRLLENLLKSGNVARWGYAVGVGEAPREHPRTNLTEDPYFTDGQRLVLFISKTPLPITSAQFIEWDQPKR